MHSLLVIYLWYLLLARGPAFDGPSVTEVTMKNMGKNGIYQRNMLWADIAAQ